MQHLSFCDCFILLSITSSRCTRVRAYVGISLRMDNILLQTYLYFVYPFTRQQTLRFLSCFGYCKWCVYDHECLSVEVSAFSSLGYMPRRGIARSYSDVLRKCLRYHKSSSVSLHSQRLRVPWTEQTHWIKGSPVRVQAVPAKRYLAL